MMNKEPHISKIEYTEKGKRVSKEIAVEYLRTIIYWSILGTALSGGVTYYVNKHFLKFGRNRSQAKKMKAGLFFTLLAGCLFRGNYFAKMKLDISRAEMMKDEECYKRVE